MSGPREGGGGRVRRSDTRATRELAKKTNQIEADKNFKYKRSR